MTFNPYLYSGAGPQTGTKFQYACPQGTSVTEIRGHSGSGVDGIQVVCSDGTTSQYYGGKAGTYWVDLSDRGFNAMEGKFDTGISNIRFRGGDSHLHPVHGGGTGKIYQINCPPNTVFRGLKGYVDSKLRNIAPLCDMPLFGKKPIPPPVTSPATGGGQNVPPPGSTPTTPVQTPYTPPSTQPEPEVAPSTAPNYLVIILVLVFIFAIVMGIAYFVLGRR